MRHWLVCLFLLVAFPAMAGEVQVVDDFEFGVHGWYLVEGKKPAGAGPLCVMTPSRDAKMGRGCARLRFQACPDTWTHMQLNVDPLDWVGADCDRIAFWLKGNGSGEKLNVMFGNYTIKPALSFRYPVMLDFTDWRRFVVPLNDFTPTGQFQAALARIVLVQLDVSGTKRPVDVLIDDILALPAERGGKPGRFFDLDVLPTGGWDTPAPSRPMPVDNVRGLPPKTVLGKFLHGVRNHKDLHNPVSFAVDHPEVGTFAVKVTETSGYGGSRLIVLLDGTERLRRDFPGETGTSLTQYQGYYSIEVPAGRHTIKVDNDGNDWITVEAYRFANYSTAGVKVLRDRGAAAVTLLERDGRPLGGAEVVGSVAGDPLPFTRAGAVFTSESLQGRYPSGRYPVMITARRGWSNLLTTQQVVRVASSRLFLQETAFKVGRPVELPVRYSDEMDLPVSGAKLTLSLSGRTRALTESGEGIYRAELGVVPAGVYEGIVSAAGGPCAQIKFGVYDLEGRPMRREGIIRLSREGRFLTQEGRPYMPWGCSTIGVFVPDAEIVSHPPGDASWCRASDEAVLAWIGLLRSCGINCVRFGVTVSSKSIGGDRGGHADPFIVERLRHYLDLIEPLGVRAIPVMWWGHYRNFRFEGVPAYDELIKKQADWFTDPKALALQKQYVREVAEPFKDDPRILAWEVMNETYRAGGDLPAAARWANEIIAAIRSADPNHLITISACEATPAPETEWMRRAKIDFFNYHSYPSYPDYRETRKWLGGAPGEVGNYAAMMALADRLGGKVNILGETGNDRWRDLGYPEARTLITRDCLWLALLCGSPGGIGWEGISDPREFDVISRLAARVDWNSFVPAAAPVAVRVADLNADLGNLARYSWWSLEKGAPVEFIATDAAAKAGQTVLAASRVRTPWFPASHLRVSPGFQSKYMVSQDRRVFLAYVRNVGGVLPQNARTRSPKKLTIQLSHLGAGNLEVWDLDHRVLLQAQTFEGRADLDLGVTRHDFAVFVFPK